jgi:2-(1,2-epoxy-1,2-dihydrophenyl)acetyl-CoA isomerase
MSEIEFEVSDAVATIRLNRPERLNAFTLPMIDSWYEALLACRDDPKVKVVVLTGTGRAFCSGGDTKSMGERAVETAFERKSALYDRILRIPRLLEDFDKPYICALNGLAYGAGLDMALMADIRFAAQSARFSESYIKVGLVAGDGGTWYLPRLVGVSKALEMLWTGDAIDATEAERIGLVNKTVPDDELMDHTYAFARRLASAPSQTIRMTKRAVYQGMRMDLRTSLDMVSSHFGVITTTEDQKEAISAFNEKRPPRFTDR